MRAFVFTDPALTSRAGQFVWLELNVDDERNAAHRERLSLEALPTFYVLNPADESVVMRRVDGMTVAEMGGFLDEARAAATGAAPSSPAEAALLRADRLNGEGKKAEAAAAYREALDRRPPGWPPYGRAVVALLFLQQSLSEDAKCLALAREALPRLSGGSPPSVMVARSGLDCALGLGKDDASRAAAIAEMEAATRKTVADASLGAAADDVSTSYLSLIQARKDAGDAAGARKDAEAWAAFLEAQAAAAKTPEQRAVFDSHRLSAYLELQQPERAIPMLQESEKDLPDDYNPPARLAVAYLAMKKPDEALAASNRALPKVDRPAARPRAADAIGHLRREGRRGGLARGPRAGPRVRRVAARGPALRGPDQGAQEEAGGAGGEAGQLSQPHAPPCERANGELPDFLLGVLPRLLEQRPGAGAQPRQGADGQVACVPVRRAERLREKRQRHRSGAGPDVAETHDRDHAEVPVGPPGALDVEGEGGVDLSEAGQGGRGAALDARVAGVAEQHLEVRDGLALSAASQEGHGVAKRHGILRGAHRVQGSPHALRLRLVAGLVGGLALGGGDGVLLASALGAVESLLLGRLRGSPVGPHPHAPADQGARPQDRHARRDQNGPPRERSRGRLPPPAQPTREGQGAGEDGAVGEDVLVAGLREEVGDARDAAAQREPERTRDHGSSAGWIFRQLGVGGRRRGRRLDLRPAHGPRTARPTASRARPGRGRPRPRRAASRTRDRGGSVSRDHSRPRSP